ncbi:MAG TPA: zinc ABC transporter substrate-binding protein [Candidatus Corynebacterium gallistercoris]|uniref:Zinc ABC transporter substrate-binding protein n=1 Tax=Candidatus Corynebacterium gallistercoris TaxID=2838530 RepID=A0A9D1RWS9_9CORY|nr:zinc ABC transporter substrate-binding protein [Candidatus Corynebacterium gallistercoris]
MKRIARSFAGAAAIAGLTLGLTACAEGGSNDKPADDGTIKIVASTSVWGSIAETATEDMDGATEVVTILSSKDDDPHEYEATAQDLAELKTADVVVANGGGYDNWLTDNVTEGTPIVSALPLAEGHDHDHDHGAEGHDHDHGAEGHDHGPINPHAWLDMDMVSHFGDHLAQQLNELNPELPDRAPEVTKKAHELKERIAKLSGARVILTESLATDVILDSDLEDVTPNSFADAVAKEAEPSAADIATTRQLIEQGKVDILITNTQSQTPAAETLIEAAKAKDIPVININETPDPGQSYFDYADTFITELEKASK